MIAVIQTCKIFQAVLVGPTKHQCADIAKCIRKIKRVAEILHTSLLEEPSLAITI
jgi:hypothetical protein